MKVIDIYVKVRVFLKTSFIQIIIRKDFIQVSEVAKLSALRKLYSVFHFFGTSLY